ncbi:hypothetical protein EVG20_g9135 [Dentipellis fragilis]|uniref:Uncharacterized protein n=1 Tax=Dentipellis fragilis TaxID=205917 RepID=A0A4Y9Y546_9AGAM|nr:hypothetical protein EVG20_g9135 [Dentipellis fragilis]
MLDHLRVDGMSEDDSDVQSDVEDNWGYPPDIPVYRILRKHWRSPRVTAWLHAVDIFYPEYLQARPKQQRKQRPTNVHICVESSHYVSADRDPVVGDLPIDAYSDTWLRRLNAFEMQKFMIREDKTFGFKHNQETKRYIYALAQKRASGGTKKRNNQSHSQARREAGGSGFQPGPSGSQARPSGSQADGSGSQLGRSHARPNGSQPSAGGYPPSFSGSHTHPNDNQPGGSGFLPGHVGNLQCFGQILPTPCEVGSVKLAGTVVLHYAAFMSSGRSLVVAYFEHGIFIWSLSSRSVKRVIVPVHSRIGQAALSTKEKLIAVSNLCNGFDVYRIIDGIHLHHFPTTVTPNCILPVLFVHDDHSLLCGSACGFVTIYDIKSQSLQQVLHHPGGGIISAMAYHKSAHQLIGTGSAETKDSTAVRLWRFSTVAPGNRVHWTQFVQIFKLFFIANGPVWEKYHTTTSMNENGMKPCFSCFQSPTDTAQSGAIVENKSLFVNVDGAGRRTFSATSVHPLPSFHHSNILPPNSLLTAMLLDSGHGGGRRDLQGGTVQAIFYIGCWVTRRPRECSAPRSSSSCVIPKDLPAELSMAMHEPCFEGLASRPSASPTGLLCITMNGEDAHLLQKATHLSGGREVHESRRQIRPSASQHLERLQDNAGVVLVSPKVLVQ